MRWMTCAREAMGSMGMRHRLRAASTTATTMTAGGSMVRRGRLRASEESCHVSGATGGMGRMPCGSLGEV
jgi:hypothetical protein